MKRIKRKFILRPHFFAMLIVVGFACYLAAPNLILPSTEAATSTSLSFAYVNDVPQLSKSNCIVCHTEHSGGMINDFGKDFMTHDHSIEAIASIDSDGDGFTNQEEFEAGTLPGDPDDHPPTPTPTPTPTATVTTTTQKETTSKKSGSSDGETALDSLVNWLLSMRELIKMTVKYGVPAVLIAGIIHMVKRSH